ncbi:hypothetical protein HT655_09455, partial [Ursidibacter maritimus]|uniref:hypothetical protein n=1 Tax=Ursidibacter maritimus TaxID=1331689 RepID=UPI001C467373
MLNEKDIIFGKKRRDWNDRSLLLKWREKWECKSNEILSSKGVDKITSKSYSTLYEEAKKNNDIKNMELYSNLMRFRTHFSSKDIYNNKNIISSVREEKNRIRDEIIKKYDKANNEVKNESKYINGRETSYYKCRRGKNPFDRIRKTIKNSINRVRSRIRGLSFEVQLFRQIIISKATGKINYGEWKRKRVNGIINSNKKSIKSYEKYSKSNNYDFSEWFDSLELNIKEFCIP